MLLHAHNLHCQRHNSALLTDVSFALHAGQITCVLGPNGAGKSTLIKVLSGEWSLSQGQITLLQQPLSQWALPARACHMACLPQISQLNFPFKVADVVLMGRVPFTTGTRVNQKIAHQAMALMDIEYLAGRVYTEISGGEKQRVQLARVIAQAWPDADKTPRLMILDEPSGALDLGHKQQLLAALKFLTGEGVSVLMVEHDLNLALHCADQILALQCGHVKALGTTHEVITADLIADLFQANVSLQMSADGRGVSVCY